MRFFSTFTGIGGFDLGLERAGWQCGGQVELEPFCNSVLEKHWPNVWRWNDVKTLTGKLISDHCGRIDALVGGPPCQPASVAGQRRGAADDRWLWPDFLRLVSEIKPVWVLAENPRGVLSIDVEGLQFSEWLASQFADRGYELMPVELAAEDVGAPHRRERIWFVARLADASCPERRAAAEGRLNDDYRADTRWEEAPGRSEFCGEAMADAEHNRRERRQPEGRRTGPACLRGEPRELGDTDSARPQEHARKRGDAREELAPTLGASWPARPGEQQYEWEEPRVLFDRRTAFSVSLLDADTGRRGSLIGVVGKVRGAFKSALGLAVDGLSRQLARWRVASLKACGNAVVPQCAEVIGRAILNNHSFNVGGL